VSPDDLDMLAYDIADVSDRGGYPLDVDQNDIRAALPSSSRTSPATLPERTDP
jgi:hypothetical protein